MSLDNLNNNIYPLSLDGLSTITADYLTVGGTSLDPTSYVKYTGADKNVDLGNYNINAGQGGFTNIGTQLISMNPSSSGYSQIITSDVIKIQSGAGFGDLIRIDTGNYRTTFVTPITVQNGSTDVFRTDGLSRIFLPFVSLGTIKDQNSYMCINSSNQLVLTSLTPPSFVNITGTSANQDFRLCMLLGFGVQTPYIDNNNFLRYNPGTGALTLATGSFTMSNGSLTLSSGNATLTSGNLTLTSGNATLTSGNLTLTSGDATLSNGNLTFNEFTNINSGGYINKVGAINFNTGRYNGQLFIGDGTNNYLSFVNSYYGGGTPYVLFNQVASIAKNIQMSNSLGENFLYTNDSATYPFSISAGVYRAISIISTGSTPIMKLMSIGANPLVSMTNVRASFYSLNGAPLEIYQPLTGAGYTNHIRFLGNSAVLLHMIGQDDTTGNGLFTNPSGVPNALCIGSNYNYPTIIYNSGTPIFRFYNSGTNNYLDTTNGATISLGSFFTGTASRTPYMNITGSGDIVLFGNSIGNNAGNLIINTQGTILYLNSAGSTFLTLTKVGTGVYQTSPAGGFVWNISGGGNYMTLDSALGLTINGTSATSIVTTANLNAIASSHLLFKVDNYTYSHKFYYGAQHNLSINGLSSTITELNQPNGGNLNFASGGSTRLSITPTITLSWNKFNINYPDYVIHQVNRTGAYGVNYGVATDYSLGSQTYARTGSWYNAVSGSQGGWFADCLLGGVIPSDSGGITTALINATWSRINLRTDVFIAGNLGALGSQNINFYPQGVYKGSITLDGCQFPVNYNHFGSAATSNLQSVAMDGQNGAGWIGGAFGGNGASDRIVAGGLGGYGAMIGAHSSGLNAWATMYVAFPFNVYPSDMKLKENIKDADTAICCDTINKIHLVRFNYKKGTFDGKDRTITGVLAQEFQEIFPKSIQEVPIPDSEDTIKSINLDQLNYTLVGAVQEQHKIIVEQENKIKNQEDRIKHLEGAILQHNILLSQIVEKLNKNVI
jgi:hypothetical protein